MSTTNHPEVLLRRGHLLDEDMTDGQIARSIRDGDIERITAGVYVDPRDWNAADGLTRHRLRVEATFERLRTEVVLSHYAAAAIWGIRILGRWPKTVDVLMERTSGGRSNGALRRRCTGFDGVEITTFGRYTLTSPAQTVADLARELPFADAVAMIDSALWRRRAVALTSLGGLFERVAASEGKRGWRRAIKAAEFASPLSDSVFESLSRVLIHRLGFPMPLLQQSFWLPSGARYETDFFWPDFDHVGECDGRSKYSDPSIRDGRTPEQVVIDEKNRENDLRRIVRRFSRWEPRDLLQPERLYDILTRDGLPASKLRPRYLSSRAE